MSGQIHFSPLLKWIFPSCQRVKSGFSETLADSGLPFPIGSISPVALPPTVRYSGFLMTPKPAQLWQAVHFSHNGAHTNLLRLYTVLGPRYNSHVPAEKIYH